MAARTFSEKDPDTQDLPAYDRLVYSGALRVSVFGSHLLPHGSVPALQSVCAGAVSLAAGERGRDESGCIPYVSLVARLANFGLSRRY